MSELPPNESSIAGADAGRCKAAAHEARGVPETDQLDRVNRENSLTKDSRQAHRGGRRSRRKGNCATPTHRRNSGNLNNKLHHYCRNPRCGSKLKEPVENPHAAFCCRGCWEQYYRHRCVVCEKEIKRTVENKRICRRRKCRNELRKWPQVYLPPQFQRAKPDKSGISEPSSPSRYSRSKRRKRAQKTPMK